LWWGKNAWISCFVNKSFREISFCMFASNHKVNADSILKWMSDFLVIGNVAKCSEKWDRLLVVIYKYCMFINTNWKILKNIMDTYEISMHCSNEKVTSNLVEKNYFESISLHRKHILWKPHCRFVFYKELHLAYIHLLIF